MTESDISNISSDTPFSITSVIMMLFVIMSGGLALLLFMDFFKKENEKINEHFRELEQGVDNTKDNT